MVQDDVLRALGDALHDRLRRGEDRRVTAEIAEAFLPPLVKALTRKFSTLPDSHQIQMAATDALMAYFRQPEKFDPARSSLIAYLYLIARRDLLNFLDREKKFVALDLAAAEYEVTAAISADHPADNPEARLLEAASPVVRLMLEKVTDPVDRELVRLMMEGERETSAYAAVLGIEACPLDDQAAIVKKHKDRLKKRLRRELKRRKGRWR
jgi:RNA polymerase sigma-70 factor (ECF subfamily)